MVSQFIDAYSDDQIYLEMLEQLVNAHPTEANVPDSIRYSSFCRLWAVMMVGGVECMVKEWASDKPMLSDIKSYLDKGSNSDRLDRLKSVFLLRGLQVVAECFEDFLAVKYVRNAYVHGAWIETQRAYVIQRGFPDSLMSFDKTHFERIKASYIHVMNRLGMANALNAFLEKRFGGDSEKSGVAPPKRSVDSDTFTLGIDKGYCVLRKSPEQFLVHRHKLCIQLQRQRNEFTVVSRTVAIPNKFQHIA
jgi:hypothetical protein